VEKIRNTVHIAERFYIGVNDGLAIDAMREKSLNEIYSRDKHFDKIPGIQRIWK
jgi:predicted nucleic acid-binding protein